MEKQRTYARPLAAPAPCSTPPRHAPRRPPPPRPPPPRAAPGSSMLPSELLVAVPGHGQPGPAQPRRRPGRRAPSPRRLPPPPDPCPSTATTATTPAPTLANNITSRHISACMSSRSSGLRVAPLDRWPSRTRRKGLRETCRRSRQDVSVRQRCICMTIAAQIRLCCTDTAKRRDLLARARPPILFGKE